jgi:tetratricopeptide (TPR) repeat protein
MLSRRVLSLLLPIALLTSALQAEDSPAFASAVTLYQSRQYPEARTAFQILSTDEPQNAAVRYYLGRIAMKRNDTDDAMLQFEKAVELDPNQSDYYMELGSAYGDAAKKASLVAQMGFAKKCRFALEKAVMLNPRNLDARQGLVDYYRQAPSFLGGGITKAYAQATEIRQHDLERGTLILGQLYFMDRRFEEAIDLALELIAEEPDNYIGHYSIGRIAAESGTQMEVGEQHLRRCLALNPGKGEPSHAAVHWRLGNIAERRGNPPAARAAYEESLKLDPNFKQALASLSKLK